MRILSNLASSEKLAKTVSCPRRHLIYATLIRCCLCLYDDSYNYVRRDWGLEEVEIIRLGLVSVPTNTLNLFACQELARRFGDLGQTPGLYKLRGLWRLDVDEKYSQRGLILPVRDDRLHIVSLRVFRHTKDQFPFTLQTRTESRRLEAA